MKRVLVSFVLLAATPAAASDFTYNPPGSLAAGSGTGSADETVYGPGIRFPIERAPAFANSQVWGDGGMYGPGGSECDAANYSYPWADNFCETRSYNTPLCPSGTGHQGQDIRASTCANKTHWAVAAEDGTISYIGTYSVNLVGASGTLYKYLHMDPATLPVKVGDEVGRGQHMGLVSDAFGDSSTTYHLHFEMLQNVEGIGLTHVPPYMSLVRAYETLLDEQAAPCEVLPALGGVLDNEGPCLLLYGPAATWRHVADAGYDGSLYWTYAWSSANPGNWAEWLVDLAEAGEYELAIYVTSDYAQSQAVPYRLRHDGQDEVGTLDMSTASGWLVVGSYTFARGGDQSLALFDNSGEDLADKRQIAIDAVRLVRLDAPTDADDDPPVVDPPDTSEPPKEPPPGDGAPPNASPEGAAGTSRGCAGCAAGESGGAWLIALGLALWRRRR